MLNFCLFKRGKKNFHLVEQAYGYNFKLSERKTSVVSRCFVRNPNMLTYVLAPPITWKKALVE